VSERLTRLSINANEKDSIPSRAAVAGLRLSLLPIAVVPVLESTGKIENEPA